MREVDLAGASVGLRSGNRFDNNVETVSFEDSPFCQACNSQSGAAHMEPGMAPRVNSLAHQRSSGAVFSENISHRLSNIC